MTNADQRITEDVEKFAFCISELYSYTFKPLLDVLLFSRSLAEIMGYKAQFLLYGYYLLSAVLLRAVAPPLALITAQETGLSGALRAAHQARAPPVERCLIARSGLLGMSIITAQELVSLGRFALLNRPETTTVTVGKADCEPDCSNAPARPARGQIKTCWTCAGG